MNITAHSLWNGCKRLVFYCSSPPWCCNFSLASLSFTLLVILFTVNDNHMNDRRCKLCGNPYIGRRDKVFCSTGCKSDYHQHLKHLSNKVARSTDKILHRNRSILYEVLGDHEEQKKIDRDALAKKNFRFEYMTGLYENAKGKRYHLLYDYAWMAFKTGDVLVLRRKKMEEQLFQNRLEREFS